MLRVLFGCLIGVAFLGSFASTPRAQDWDGAYIGAHAGVRWAELDLSTPSYQFSDGAGGILQVPAGNRSFRFRNAIGGLQGGYNVLLGGGWLSGIEGDISWGRDAEGFFDALQSSRQETETRTVLVTRTITELVPCECEEEFIEVTREIQVPRQVTTTRTINSNATSSSDLDLEAQGTIRLRFGFVAGDILYYATGGIAFTRAEWRNTISIAGGASQTVSKSDTLTGFAVGGGLQTFISPELLLGVDYLYEDFGSMDVPLAFTAKTGDLDVSAHKVRVSLSYKF